jgi:hypothetical protein
MIEGKRNTVSEGLYTRYGIFLRCEKERMYFCTRSGAVRIIRSATSAGVD